MGECILLGVECLLLAVYAWASDAEDAPDPPPECPAPPAPPSPPSFSGAEACA